VRPLQKLFAGAGLPSVPESLSIRCPSSDARAHRVRRLLALLALVQMAVRLEEQRTAVGVSETLTRHRGIHSCERH